MISDKMLKSWRKEAILLREKLSGWDSINEYTKERRKMAVRICELAYELENERIISESLRKSRDNLYEVHRMEEENSLVDGFNSMIEQISDEKKNQKV